MSTFWARDLHIYPDWRARQSSTAAIAQLGERQTEDLKVPGSIPGGGTFAIRAAPVAEWLRYAPPKGGIVGASPTRGA